MAAKNYTTPQDQQFIDAFRDQAGKGYEKWGKEFPNKPTFLDKLNYIQTIYDDAKSEAVKDIALAEGVKWIQANNPQQLLKKNGTPFTLADYQGVILLNAKGTKSRTDSQTFLTTARKQAAIDVIKGSSDDTPNEQIVDRKADVLVNGDKTTPYDPAEFIKGFNTVVAPTLVTPSGSLADITKQYGSLYTKSGKPLFSDTELKNVYNGSPEALQSFRAKLNTAVEDTVKATDPSFAKAGGNEGAAYVAARNKLLNDPAGSLTQSYNTTVSGLKTSDKGGWVTPSNTVVGGPVTSPGGITGLLPKGSYKDANGNFAYTGGEIDSKDMTEFTQSYNPNKGVYLEPTLDASGKLVSNPTSPYSNILNSMLSNPKNPFASGYTSSLDSMQPAAMTSTQLASLNKPFTANTTASDLVKLVNSAGGEYDPTNKAGSTLSPALRQIYQTQTSPDGTVGAKPGVPDPTIMKVPGANFLDPNGDLLYGDIAGGDLTNTPMGGDAKTAEDSAYGFTPDTTLKNVPGADITGDSGTLTKPTITDKATADALHKVEQDRIAKEAADKAEAAKKALYYNADGTLTGLGFYTFNPTGNYQDYLNTIAAGKDETDTTLTDKGKDETDPQQTDFYKLAREAQAELAANLKERADFDKLVAEAKAQGAFGGLGFGNEVVADTSTDTSISTDTPTYTFTEGDYIAPGFRERTSLQERAMTDPQLAAQLQWSVSQDAKYAQPTGTPLTGIASTQAAKDTIAGVSNSAVKSPIGNLLRNQTTQNTSDTASGINTLVNSPDITTQSLTTPPANAKPAVIQQGAVGIAGNPNVGSFTSADNMNTSATGVGAPITTLLTPNTGASGTPTVTQKPAVIGDPWDNMGISQQDYYDSYY